MVMGDVVPVDPNYKYTPMCNELYDELFDGEEEDRLAMRVPDWYGEDGGTKGVQTEPMSRVAFIVIGNGKPLLLGCQDPHAGTFHIIGRGVNAMLRFTEYDEELPADMEPDHSVYKPASAYVFIAVPPGAPAPETYNETMLKMCSERDLDSREEAHLNRLLLEALPSCSED